MMSATGSTAAARPQRRSKHEICDIIVLWIFLIIFQSMTIMVDGHDVEGGLNAGDEESSVLDLDSELLFEGVVDVNAGSNVYIAALILPVGGKGDGHGFPLEDSNKGLHAAGRSSSSARRRP